MTTEKQSKPKGAVKNIRCPAHVHGLILELQALMAEQGHQAYYLGAHGQVKHGNVRDAPLHIPLAWALTTAIEILHPARAQFAAAHEAREDYLESFKEGPEETE